MGPVVVHPSIGAWQLFSQSIRSKFTRESHSTPSHSNSIYLCICITYASCMHVHAPTLLPPTTRVSTPYCTAYTDARPHARARALTRCPFGGSQLVASKRHQTGRRAGWPPGAQRPSVFRQQLVIRSASKRALESGPVGAWAEVRLRARHRGDREREGEGERARVSARVRARDEG